MNNSRSKHTASLTTGSTVKDGAFAEANFARKGLTDCVFEQCDFTDCNFRACDLTSTRFVRCQFNNDASDNPADFAQANLRETTFRHCNLTVVSFQRSRAYGLHLEHCQLQGADFEKADFRLPVGESDLVDFHMTDCNFAYGSFANTYLAHAVLAGTRMNEACLDYCDLTGADLTGCELNNLSARGVTLIDADLRGAAFNNINPREIDLRGVRLTVSQVPALLAPIGIELEADPTL